MSPITNKSQAKEGGFAQVRESLQSFKGRVVRAEFGQWGGKLIDDDGRPVPPREYLEVESTEVEPLEVTEELSMDISEQFQFRVNCSDFKGSFWIEKFLESADKFKVLIPDDLVGKVVTWSKVTLEAFNRDGEPNPKYNSTNYVIAGVQKGVVPKVVSKPKPALQHSSPAPVVEPEEDGEEATDPLDIAMSIAVGKTEAQFRAAISIDPRFAGSPMIALAKAGGITTALLNEGKLVKDGTGKYQLPTE